MSETGSKKPRTDTEVMLVALDQISQTIEVMTSVVGRLRAYLREHEASRQPEAAGEPVQAAPEANQTIH